MTKGAPMALSKGFKWHNIPDIDPFPRDSPSSSRIHSIQRRTHSSRRPHSSAHGSISAILRQRRALSRALSRPSARASARPLHAPPLASSSRPSHAPDFPAFDGGRGRLRASDRLYNFLYFMRKTFRKPYACMSSGLMRALHTSEPFCARRARRPAPP